MESIGRESDGTPPVASRAYLERNHVVASPVSTTDIAIGKISNISNIFASGTDKGIFELAGKSKIGQALGDEMDHMEFYVNKKAMVSTMSELFGIVEQKNKE